MTGTRTIEYEIHRYQPDDGDDGGRENPVYNKQTWQTFSVEVSPGMTVLDGLLQIRERQDASLVWRFSCRMGICGSCGMMINGNPGLACNTQILDVSQSKVRLGPLRSFPVLRDLLVDLTSMFDKHRALKPFIVRDHEGNRVQRQGQTGARNSTPAQNSMRNVGDQHQAARAGSRHDPDEKGLAELWAPAGDYQQSPGELLDFLQFSDCIKCGVCMSACPTVASDDHFPGPMPLTSAHRYNSDSRDHGFAERKAALGRYHGTSHCHYAAECSRACPKGVDPALAIQLLGRSLVADALHLRRTRTPARVLGRSKGQPGQDIPQAPAFTAATESPARTEKPNRATIPGPGPGDSEHR
ncbi:MAG: succinate dehydrogenase/fumarate reductase iron-sulfur subunit [Proteobacteria bacterium]|nr:succinate dehydrogenase/fumarate reductase iron-sulfur subunit [Pseudomonadota bacterium]MDA1299880.1 succinate dehydrogenase/fumarate reductase iron-sulfur subunit [Pseudomonadota bacterium]